MSAEQQILHVLDFIKSALWQIFLIVGMVLWMASYIKDHLPKRAIQRKKTKRRDEMTGEQEQQLALLPEKVLESVPQTVRKRPRARSR